MRLAIVFALLIPAAAGAQSLLELEVRATQKDAPVTDLKQVDFSLREAGKPKAVESIEYVETPAETKLYIGLEAPATDFPRIQQAIERFVTDDLPEGMEVSMGGAPFTSDRTLLAEYVGKGVALPSETPDAGLPKLWGSGAQFELQGEAALARYIELAARLQAVPGRKAVILFRPDLGTSRQGLDFRTTQQNAQDRENIDVDFTRTERTLDKLGAVALFSRTTFYPAYSSQSQGINQQGLAQIAAATGGKPTLGTGDPAVAFKTVLDDASDYYVLGFKPTLTGKGNPRSLKVEVDRKGVDLRHARSFLDIEGLGTAPAATVSALDVDGEASLTTVSQYYVFRGSDGKPLLLFTAGADLQQLEAEESGKGFEVGLTLAGGFSDGDGGWAAREQRTVRQVFAKKPFQKAQKDGGVLVDVSAVLRPATGEQDWKLVLRDENSGKFGLDERRFLVPSFTLPLDTSSMVVTRRAVPIESAEAQPWGELLDYGESRFIPESSTNFTIGDTVLFTYRLYGPPAAMLQGEPEVQVALLKDEAQLDAFEWQGSAQVVEGAGGAKEIQYMGAIRTNGLEPGNYLILSAVPGREDARQPYIEGAFTLQKK